MADYDNVVKGDSFYHVYNRGQDDEKWRYIRPASNTIKPITAIGSSPQRTGVTAPPSVSSRFSASTPTPFVAPKVNAGNPDPRDAGYFTDIGKLDAYFKNRTADLNAASASARVQHGYTLEGIGLSRKEGQASHDATIRDIGEALETLRHNKPIDVRNQTNASNKAGLLYSGFQNEALGNIEFEYGQREEGFANQKADTARQLAEHMARLGLSERQANTGLAEALAGYQRQIGELNQLYGPSGLERQSVLQQAIARQLERDQAAAAAGAGAVAAKPTQASGGYKNVVKNGKFYHYYPKENRWVYIRPASR